MAAVENPERDFVVVLPLVLAQNIFRRLSVDARARCAAVRRGWYVALAERSLWTRLDLTWRGGVGRTRDITDAFLLGAAARAGGMLEVLDVSEIVRSLKFETLLAVATANAGALRELHATNQYGVGLQGHEIRALLLAAPQLRVLDADVVATFADALRVVHNEPPFAVLRAPHVFLFDQDAAADDVNADALRTLAAGVQSYAPLTQLRVCQLLLDAAAVDAVVDAAAAASNLRELALQFCPGLSHACAPALARLLRGRPSLTKLSLSSCGARLLDGPASALLCDALRENCTLTDLSLQMVAFWSDPVAAAALLGALTAHPSLQSLNLSLNHGAGEAEEAAVAFAALGALVLADAVALKFLSVRSSDLGDAGLAPLIEALPRNTHLEDLDCGCNAITCAFAQQQLLPAVRANRSLWQLCAQNDYLSSDDSDDGDDEDGEREEGEDWPGPRAAREAELLVTQRAEAEVANA
jgi:hypothetical protein